MLEKLKEKYYGRLVPIKTSDIAKTHVDYVDTIICKGQKIYCYRCGGKTPLNEGRLPNDQIYCRKCLNLGRISSLIRLGTLPEPNNFSKGKSYLKWQGKLTAAQNKCSRQIIDSINQKTDRLLWAVTGAGKTEMLFPGIDHGLMHGKRICICSPRVDVVLELFPRLQKAFPEQRIMLLHGRAIEPYEYTQFVLCTTHQLLRFYHAFDVLIIDEVDSFPFATNDELHFAVQHAKKIKSSVIYLTATPDGELLKNSRKGKMATSYLTQRFHGHPLPEIQATTGQNWIKRFNKNQLPHCLKKFIDEQIENQRQFLIFVPQIKELSLVMKVIQKKYPELRILTVHAADQERIEKVQLMREQKLDVLVTTTILERGVTFPGIDVAVLGADDQVFSMAALVQIAGRVGRSPQRPTGTVLFICSMLNRNIKRAQKQIKFMNRKTTL